MHSILAEEKKFKMIFTQLLMQTRITRKYLDSHFFFQPRNDNQWKLYLISFAPYAFFVHIQFLLLTNDGISFFNFLFNLNPQNN